SERSGRWRHAWMGTSGAGRAGWDQGHVPRRWGQPAEARVVSHGRCGLSTRRPMRGPSKMATLPAALAIRMPDSARTLHHFHLRNYLHRFPRVQSASMRWEGDMAFMKGVEPNEAGWCTRLGYWFVRRKIGKVTGKDRLVEPVKIAAHHPGLFK